MSCIDGQTFVLDLSRGPSPAPQVRGAFKMGFPTLVLAGVIASVALSPPGVTVPSKAGSLSSAHLRTVWMPAAEGGCAGSGRSLRETARSDRVVYSLCCLQRILANRATGKPSSDRSLCLELRGGSERVGDLLLEDGKRGEESRDKQADGPECPFDSFTRGEVCTGADARRREGASVAATEQEEETGENAGEEEDNAKGTAEEGEEEEDICMCCSEPLVEAARGACGHRYYNLAWRRTHSGVTDCSQVDMLGFRLHVRQLWSGK